MKGSCSLISTLFLIWKVFALTHVLGKLSSDFKKSCKKAGDEGKQLNHLGFGQLLLPQLFCEVFFCPKNRNLFWVFETVLRNPCFWRGPPRVCGNRGSSSIKGFEPSTWAPKRVSQRWQGHPTRISKMPKIQFEIV